MTTMTTRTFPLDDLLVCGNCQGRISLEHNPQPRYICENSCTAAFKASELNRLLIPEITAVVVTDATYPLLKASFIRALTETTNPDTAPSDDEIRRLIIDPDTFLAEDAVSAAAEAANNLHRTSRTAHRPGNDPVRLGFASRISACRSAPARNGAARYHQGVKTLPQIQ